ncbi:DsbA family protein [Nocardiopsis salina]|uniref:DsbA family protein n=1 Tax=Nocardiopsis salina TaxID=245836 RepID=UPI0003451238|nr:thioredoxin domain-containing protein [Nocardiopsis salina]
MSKNLAITLGLILVAVVGLGLLAGLGQPGQSPDGTEQATTPEGGPAAPEETLVREDSRYLDQHDDATVTVVEFLDFECEACRAQYPVIERIREEYERQIDVVVRYFPMPGHTNSAPAAAAVEAAAQQGALEEMYQRMFETQAEWGESQEDRSDVFVGFAEDLGLDMDEFTETMESEETLERVQADFDDGVELGVQGTPTIYVDGQQTTTMPDYETLSTMIDEGLEE